MNYIINIIGTDFSPISKNKEKRGKSDINPITYNSNKDTDLNHIKLNNAVNNHDLNGKCKYQ